MKQTTKQCYFCANNVRGISYKNTELLNRFLDPYARIMPRRQTMLCATHQRKLARIVKQARIMSLLPFVAK